MGREAGRPRITEAQARRLGYRLVRGAYYGTTDDRADRWYIDDARSDVIDRRGQGFASKREALEWLAESLALREAAEAEGQKRQAGA